MTTPTEAQPVAYPHGLLRRALLAGPPSPSPPIVFRSKLEANWANTLDRLGIKWAYEPCVFTLPDGQRYLPDFYLEELSTWIEVKGSGVPGIDKAIAFAHWRETDLVIAGYSPELIPGQGLRMRFQGAVQRCGLALCPSCHRYQWTTDAMKCRACAARIPGANFYQHHAAPFHPAQWSGD